jgi:nicotinate-nucleotide adenylyltransferase
MNPAKLQEQVNKVFTAEFGRTPLTQRLDDIRGEAIELHRFTDMRHLREELGDLLSSTIQCATECGWTLEDLIRENLAKIESRHLQYKSLGRKIQVAILGGAFNPPTLGHIEIAKYVLDTSNTFDEVWLMPCYQHMYGKEMEPPEHRLAMCEIAAKVDGRIKVCDYEIVNQLSSETYQTMKRMLEEDWAKQKIGVHMIIGMDNANSFDKWVNYAHLERLLPFVVVPRKGVEMDPKVTWYLQPPHIFLGHSEREIREVSSTEVREILRTMFTGMDVDNKLDRRVYDYILQNGLYGVKKRGEHLESESGN